MSARVLIHVQHLLGTGHLRRAAALAHALDAAGHAVDLVSGGPAVANLDYGRARFTQLPAARVADLSFRTLLDVGGRPVDDGWRAGRRGILLDLFAARRPDILITELYPFGRRILEFELLPLLDAATARTPRPLVVSSIRDILAAKTDSAKIERVVARVRASYDLVLVHGDEAFVKLAASFAAVDRIADRVAYTGYIEGASTPAPPPGDGENEVIVSVGGGAVGARLLETALDARALSDNQARRWRILVGGDVPAASRERLLRETGPGLVVEPARPDFPGLLSRCHVSVSQAGYNTVVDLLTAGARAVLVPFAGGGEAEQSLRADLLAARGWAQTLREADLTPAGLAAAIDKIALRPRPRAGLLRCGGAVQSVRLLEAALARSDGRHSRDSAVNS
jgi:predicted glycosyltransferase